MRPALITCLSAILCTMTVIPVPSAATPGVVDLSWGACSPVVTAIGSPTPGPVSVFASVVGNDETHWAYQVRVQLRALDDTVPDSWRFDAPGCQGSSRVEMSSIPDEILAKSCPPFRGPSPIVEIKLYDFYPPESGFPTTTMRGVIAVAYPVGTTSLAGQRYFLGEFRFDHGRSVPGPTTPGVNCGGADVPIVIRLQHGYMGAFYVRVVDGLEAPFEIGNVTLTVNGSVPAPSSTWGQIKDAYRR